MAADRSVDEIRSEMAKTRARVTEAVQGLITETDPRVLKNRAQDEAKSFVQTEVNNVKSWFVDDAGPRWDNIAKIVGGVVAVVAIAAGAKALTSRQQNTRLVDIRPYLTPEQTKRLRKEANKRR